jgi:hypothetical protein
MTEINRQEVWNRVVATIANFAPRSGNEKLAKLILDTVGVKGASVYFFTGGDDSEPEGAVIEIPGMPGHIEVGQASHLVDWSGVEFHRYRRYTDYPSFGGTSTFRLNEAGEVVS